MAEVFESVIKIDTGESEQSVKGLKKEIGELRDYILKLDAGTEEYAEAVGKLQEDQRKLNEVMSLTKREAVALDGSYDALVHQMSLLKKEWRATNDEARRNELGQQIAENNQQLKDFDASLGNFQREVGHYENAMNGMGGSVQDFGTAMRNSMQSVEPVKAKFESVRQIASGLASGFAAVQGAAALLGVENEDLERIFVKLQASMALAQGIGGLGDLVEGLGKAKVAFKDLGKSIKAVSATMGKTGWIAVIVAVVAAISLVTSKIKKKKKAVDELDDSLKKLQKRNSNLDESYNERARQLERDIKLMSAQGASEEEIIKKRMELNKVYEEAAKKNYKEAQKQYLGLKDSFDMGIKGVTQEDVDEAKEIYDDANMIYKEFVEKRKDLENDLVITQMNATEKVMTAEEALALASKQSMELLDEDIANLPDIELPEVKMNLPEDGEMKKRAEIAIQMAERVANRERELNASSEQSEEAKAQKDYEINLALQEKKLAILQEYYKNCTCDAKSRVELEQMIADQVAEIDRVKYEEKDRRRQEDKQKEEEALRDDLARIDSFKDGIEDFKVSWEELDPAGKIEQIGQVTSAAFGAMGDVFSQVADMQEQEGELSEKEAKKVKNLRVAGATMDMLSGVVGAISSAAPMGPVGWALGAIQAAAITATGIMNINKIKNTDLNGGGGQTPNLPAQSTYASELPVTYTRQVTGASEVEELNRDQRVYILESDIQASNRRVEVRESESSF